MKRNDPGRNKKNKPVKPLQVKSKPDNKLKKSGKHVTFREETSDIENVTHEEEEPSSPPPSLEESRIKSRSASAEYRRSISERSSTLDTTGAEDTSSVLVLDAEEEDLTDDFLEEFQEPLASSTPHKPGTSQQDTSFNTFKERIDKVLDRQNISPSKASFYAREIQTGVRSRSGSRFRSTGTSHHYSGSKYQVTLTPIYKRHRSHSSDNQISLRTRLRNFFNMAGQPPDLLTLDMDIPDLPVFPFSAADVSAENSAHVTAKQQKIQKLHGYYDSYVSLKAQIRTSELSTDPNNRPDPISHIITGLRQRLQLIYENVTSLVAEIQDINRIQNKLRPALQLPTEYFGQNMLNVQDMKEFMTATVQPGKKANNGDHLKEVWNKLKLYAETKQLSYTEFKLALMSCLTGEVLEYCMENKTLSLTDLAQSLAQRFITETSFSDAMANLDRFSRRLNEPITQAISRLKSYVDKALLTHQPGHRDAIKDFLIAKKVKEIVTAKTKRYIEAKEAEFLSQGSRMTAQTLIDLAHEEERRSGMPTSEMSTAVSLYNVEKTKDSSSSAESTNPKVEQQIQQIADNVENLTNVVETLAITSFEMACMPSPVDSIDCNVMTRSQYRNSGQSPATPMRSRSNSRPRPAFNSNSSFFNSSSATSANSGNGNRTRSSYNSAPSTGPSSNGPSSTRMANIRSTIEATRHAAAQRATQREETMPQNREPPDKTDQVVPKAPVVHDRPPDSQPQQRQDSHQDRRPDNRYDRRDRSRSADRGRTRYRNNDRNSARFPSYTREFHEHKSPYREGARTRSQSTSGKSPDSNYAPGVYYRAKAKALENALATQARYKNPYASDVESEQETEIEAEIQKLIAAKRKLKSNRRDSSNTSGRYGKPRNSAVIHAHDITIKHCELCKSPVKHELKNCYMVQKILTQVKPEQEEENE